MNKDGTSDLSEYPCYYAWDGDDDNVVYAYNDSKEVKQFEGERMAFQLKGETAYYYSYDEENSVHIRSYPMVFVSDEEVYPLEDEVSETDIYYDNYGNMLLKIEKPYDGISTKYVYEYDEKKIDGKTISLLTKINVYEYSVFDENYTIINSYDFEYYDNGYLKTTNCKFNELEDIAKIVNHDYSDFKLPPSSGEMMGICIYDDLLQ